MGCDAAITLDPETIELLKPYPFLLRFENNLWTLQKYVSIQISNKRINCHITINTYNNVDDLFFDIFESDNWYCVLSDPVKARLQKYIEYVFLDKDSSISNFKLRYAIIHQTMPRKPIGGQDIHVSFLSDLNERAKESGLEAVSTYEEAYNLAKKLKYIPPNNRSKLFSNCDELALWLFDYLVINDRMIGCCKTCNCYFVKSSTRKKYCSESCRNMRPKTTSFTEEEKIKSVHKCINQRFSRKENSKAEYSYTRGKFSEEYNERELFSRIENMAIKNDPVSSTFKAKEFTKIREAYNYAYRTRYDEVQKAKRSYLNDKISKDSYLSSARSLLAWLNNVITQLDSFEIYSHSRSK